MPYRNAPLRPPVSPLQRWSWGAVAVGVAGAVIAASAWRGGREVQRRVAVTSAVERVVRTAHARRMASGSDHVSVLYGEGDRAVVVRLPGRLVRRGTDVLRVPEVVPSPGAVALMPDGAWAIDAQGVIFDASSTAAVAACPRRPCVAQSVPGHGRVVQVTTTNAARLEDGALARRRDGSSFEWVVEGPSEHVVDFIDGDGAHVELHRDGTVSPERNLLVRGGAPASLALGIRDPRELSVGAGLACVIDDHGGAACGNLLPLFVRSDLLGHARFEPVAGVPSGRVAQLAHGGDELCALDFDGRLSCGLVRENDAFRVERLVLSEQTDLGAVREVALSRFASCARLRNGEVRCWGEGLEHGGVVRRDVPVALADLDAVERLAAVGLRVCALQRGRVICWGERWSDIAATAPTDVSWPLPTGEDVREVAAVGECLCVRLDGGAIRCTDSRKDTLRWREPEGGTPAGARALAGNFHGLFILDGQSRAWSAQPDGARFAFRRVPVLDGYERLMSADSLMCAVRGGALRCPPHDDPSGINRGVGAASWQIDVRRLQRRLPHTVAPEGALVQSDLMRDQCGEEANADEAAVREALADEVRATVRLGSVDCLLGVGGRVACLWDDPWDVPDGVTLPGQERAALVPGLDDAVELAVMARNHACARRATGAVVCWGRNVGGVLTGTHADRTRRYPLDELLDRARR